MLLSLSARVVGWERKKTMPTDEYKSAVRAFQAWPLLTFATRHHQIFTYEELGQHLGLPSVAVVEALGPILRYCQSKGLPLLNLIVVNKNTGKPTYEEFRKYDIPEQQAKVFLHKWFDEENHAKPVPLIEDFQEHVKSEDVKSAAV
jgi:hypothetical protein